MDKSEHEACRKTEQDLRDRLKDLSSDTMNAFAVLSEVIADQRDEIRQAYANHAKDIQDFREGTT